MGVEEPAFLVCLMGLPGAGKSSLARVFSSTSSRACVVVSFDDFPTRAQALDAVAQAIRKYPACDVIVDDNSYYRSMRREIWCLARDAQARMLFVLVDTPLETCLQRNAARKGAARIPDEVVVRMAQRMQRPANHGWDRAILVQGDETMDKLRVLGAIPPMKQEKTTDGSASPSELELFDLQLRKEISERVLAAAPEERPALAKQLNMERKSKLASFKKKT